MHAVLQKSLPHDALLATHRGGKHPELWGGYGDCFVVSIDRTVALAEFVVAFYTSPVFRIERWILRVAAGAPSTDQEARDLMAGSRDSFAVWSVAERTDTQLLMGDRYGKTRSWFRVTPQESAATLLQFGSAVASRSNSGAVPRARGSLFGLLLKFHVVYSQVLLHAAKRGVMRKQRARPG